MLVCAPSCAHCTRDRGCSAHPAFPAPSLLRGAKITCKPRAQCVAGMQTHIQSSSPGLPPPLKLRRASTGKPRRSLGVAGTGRPSIPETPMIEPRSRSVLDTPHTRGMTAFVERRTIHVIACDKRKAFAQGSGATKQSTLDAAPWIASLALAMTTRHNNIVLPASLL